MDKLKLRQICFLFAAVLPVTKLIITPPPSPITQKTICSSRLRSAFWRRGSSLRR